MLVSSLGSCPSYRGEFVWSKLSVDQVYVKKNLVNVLTFLLQIIHDDEMDLSLSEKKMTMWRKIKGAVKKVNRDLLCVLFFTAN